MQRVRAIVRKFVLPIAFFAGSAWAFAFCYMFATLPQRDVGTAVLLAFAGLVMSVPWIVMAASVLQRMREGAAVNEHDPHNDHGKP